MASSQIGKVIAQVRSAVLLRDGAGLTDGQLLGNYINRKDEAALAALVMRHGPMVWGVCQRVVRDYHDAEDAFQGAFLVFVRKAASIAAPELLANWLYGVARHTALKARAIAAKRRTKERQLTELPQSATTNTNQDLWNDLQPLLDQELSRLPEKYRIAIVLCGLEGKTRKEAAAQLGVPEGTVAAWLSRGRRVLAKRLTRRGLSVSGAALAAVLARNAASACVPTPIVSATIKAASLFATELAPSGVISQNAAALTEGVVRAMCLTKVKTIAVAILAAALVGLGVGMYSLNPPFAGGTHVATAVTSNAKAAAPKPQLEGSNKSELFSGKVRSSIENGIGYLEKRQEDRGGEWNWENSELLNQAWSGGTSCLATLALLTAGETRDDKHIERALHYIRGLKPTQTYVVALQNMVLAEIKDAKDLKTIQTNVDLLLKNRIYVKNDLTGWSYGKDGDVDADNSNTQFALLALLAGRQAGAKIAQKDWEEIQTFFIRTQIPVDKTNGGWSYRPTNNADGISHSMTCAGLSGLFISSMELGSDKQQFDSKTGIAKKCGQYAENEAAAQGMNWLGKNFKFEMNSETHKATFYNIYGIERVGRLSGQRFIGEHDWYREGCELLCGIKTSDSNQAENGSWHLGAGIDNMPVISTSFALIFLSKGRTPILIRKLAFDVSDNKNRLDWNHKHSDARHLVDYASKSLFKKQPLAWQIFDPRLADIENQDAFNDALDNLLESPILYMTGHEAPNLTPRQIELLRRYVEKGGFIFAEACGGSKKFAGGFRKLMDKVFKRESALVALPAKHAIWTRHVALEPAEFIVGREAGQLIQCIERGGKTVVVFSPQPLAGYWEDRQFMPQNNVAPTTRGELAYCFAGNVIAYATGLEMPKSRLSNSKKKD